LKSSIIAGLNTRRFSARPKSRLKVDIAPISGGLANSVEPEFCCLEPKYWLRKERHARAAATRELLTRFADTE
jgi:hypothetical protein